MAGKSDAASIPGSTGASNPANARAKLAILKK
jgi:hypothetical protein